MSGTGFASAQVTEMQQDIDQATTDSGNGNYQAAITDISDYYQVQAGVDGYAQIANDVVLDQTLNGETPDQELAEAGVSYGGKTSVHLMLDLAKNNFTDIEADEGNLPPTESQIEQEHLDAFNAVDISIADWGGTALANAGENWISNATAQELSDTINSNFLSLSSSTVSEAELNVLGAGLETGGSDFFDFATNINGPDNDQDEAQFFQQAGQDTQELYDTNNPVHASVDSFLNGLSAIGNWVSDVADDVHNTVGDVFGGFFDTLTGNGAASPQLPTVADIYMNRRLTTV